MIELPLQHALKFETPGIEDKPLFFNHDYPSEVVKIQKAYKDIKKALKENGIKFHTPLTRIRIHWQNGTITYNPQEVARELSTRGHKVMTGAKEQEDNKEKRIKEA
ncbi:hypothetical protein XENORESO_008281 [Xenotaenia resolanae]|uniref:Uncharacterized protein n=1 Tax=Xenotaenia resolanae TaxID=208358 RepID=A0ABV0X1J9_9TELE